MKKLTGKEVNAHLAERIGRLRERLVAQNIHPMLVTVRIGELPEVISYERSLCRKIEKLALGVRQIVLPEETTEEQLVEALRALSDDNAVHGILLFQPLPAHLDTDQVMAAIAPSKDVDSATLENLGKTLAGRSDGFTYGAPEAVMAFLEYYQVPLEGTNVVLIGSGKTVGRPLALLLAESGATVTMTSVHTKNLKQWTRAADILVAAAGVAEMVDQEYVAPGQIVLDVGMSPKDGKVTGDVDMTSVAPIVEAYTPTPGGVGSITATITALHLVQAACRLHGICDDAKAESK